MIKHSACSVCGSIDVFLRKKGEKQTGLYCLKCGKWNKWVGKKDIESYKARGYRIHDESYSPTFEDDMLSTEDALSPNLGVERERPSTASLLGIEDFGVETVNNFGSEQQVAYKDKVVDTNTGEIIEQERCMTCLTGTIDTTENSDDATLTIFDGVMLLRDKRGIKLYGAFPVKYCPTCGTKL